MLVAEVASPFWDWGRSDDEGRLGEGPPWGHGGSLWVGEGELRGGSIGGGCLKTDASEWPELEVFSKEECLDELKMHTRYTALMLKPSKRRTKTHTNLTKLHLWEALNVWTAVAWRATAAMPAVARRSGSSRSKMRFRGRAECARGGVSAAEAEAGWSAGVRRAYPEGRVASRNASRTLEASPPDCNGHTRPGRNHRGRESDRRWTYLQMTRHASVVKCASCHLTPKSNSVILRIANMISAKQDWKLTFQTHFWKGSFCIFSRETDLSHFQWCLGGSQYIDN